MHEEGGEIVFLALRRRRFIQLRRLGYHSTCRLYYIYLHAREVLHLHEWKHASINHIIQKILLCRNIETMGREGGHWQAGESFRLRNDKGTNACNRFLCFSFIISFC